VHRVVEHLKATGAPEYVEDILTGSGGDEEGGVKAVMGRPMPKLIRSTIRPSISC
jgi:DNA segregation ATPase FtsK/SpoIIIE-like protein